MRKNTHNPSYSFTPLSFFDCRRTIRPLPLEAVMKAVVLVEPGRLEVRDIPEPPLQSGQVMVRVRACGICGSDLRYFHGENPWAQHTLGIKKTNPPNMILGHEVSGDIVAVADPALQHRIGERVVLLAFSGCGSCFYCQHGMENICPNTEHLGHGAGWQHLEYNPGGMAEFCPVAAEMAYPLQDTISYGEATLLDGTGVAVHAVNCAELATGDTVVMMGCGPIGILSLQVARSRGIRVIAIDVANEPLTLAAKLGAEVTLQANMESTLDRVREVTEGLGVAAVLNAVGSPESITEGMRMLRMAGRQILLAVETVPVTLPVVSFAGERTLTVSANFVYPDFDKAIALMASGQVQGTPLITHCFPLEKAIEAFDIALHKTETGAVKVLLEP